MSARPFVPVEFGDAVEHRRKLAEAIRMLFDGKSANTGTLTIPAGQTSAALQSPLIAESSVIVLAPLSASAALATPFVSAQSTGVATIEHASSSGADRDYRYAIIG